jgi:hypothetical protein
MGIAAPFLFAPPSHISEMKTVYLLTTQGTKAPQKARRNASKKGMHGTKS